MYGLGRSSRMARLKVGRSALAYKRGGALTPSGQRILARLKVGRRGEPDMEREIGGEFGQGNRWWRAQ